MNRIIVLLSILCLTTASEEEVPVPWSEKCCYTIDIKWKETMSDGTTNSGIGMLVTFNPMLVTFNPTETVTGKVADPSKLQISASMQRKGTLQCAEMDFVVDIARPAPTTADVTISSKEYNLDNMFESKESAFPGHVKANKLSIVVKSTRSRIVFEKAEG